MHGHAPKFASTLLSIVSLLAISAHAAPMDPGDKPVRAQFSGFVTSRFELLTDSDDDSLLYFIPKFGALAVQSPLSTSPLPRFNVLGIIPTYGFFAGRELGSFTGVLSPVGDVGALNALILEANAMSYRVVPAPVVEATTRFIANGHVASDGRIDVSCTTIDTGFKDPNGQPVMNPSCKTRQSANEDYNIETEMMAKLNTLPLGRSTVGQSVVFSGMLTPNWTANARSLMSTGASWDIVTASTAWKIKTNRKSRQARLILNWKQLFERADAFVSLHDGRCVDVQIRAFFENIAGCKNADECGVKIEWIGDDGKPTPIATNDKDFIDVVNVAKDQLQAELFNEVRDMSKSKLGDVDTRQNALFVARANLEKRTYTRNEIRSIVWNPGFRRFEPHTDMTIQCVSGGFGLPVRWNMEDSGCKTLIGQ